jgi:hypothetical protein
VSVSQLTIDAALSTLSVQVCRSFGARLRGYGLARRARAGVWLEPCAAVHTLWPWQPIDVVFVAPGGRVLRVCSALRPGRLRWCAGARAVLELPAGSCAAHAVRIGGHLEVQRGE